MLPRMRVDRLLALDKTLAANLFARVVYPWEILSEIASFILALGESLDPDTFERRSGNVWVHRRAQVFASAYLGGPCIVDEGAEIRHCAFVRENAIVGKDAVVGNSTELKNAILFDGAQAPHYNYVGDSVLGHKAHMGAGSITSNVRLDQRPVRVRNGERFVETGLKKFGAILGDGAEIGCNSVLNPGTIIGRGAFVYPVSSVRGFVPERRIDQGNAPRSCAEEGEDGGHPQTEETGG